MRLKPASGRFFFSWKLVVLVLAWAHQSGYAQQSPAGSGTGGMVVSAQSLATEAGITILRSGGNAMDAGVAVAFALQAVWPSAGNIGGGGFALIRTADGQVYSLDFRESAPQSATETMYMAGDSIIPDRSTIGAASAGVPGTIRGLEQIHNRFGTRPWGELIQPAIRLATGHRLSEKSAAALNAEQPNLSRFPETARQYKSPDSGGWTAGTIFRQPDLAMTLTRLAENGPDEFYTGKTARLILETMKSHGGYITSEDLVGYSTRWREPLRDSIDSFEIVTMGPPSFGGIILLQTVKGIQSQRGATDQAIWFHRLFSGWQRSYADRAAWGGDPAFTTIPTDSLISQSYINRRLQIWNSGIHQPSSESRAGDIPGFEPGETTHFAVADSAGNCISVTYTLNGGFGSYLVVDGAGFLLNNEMDDFSVAPGVPNLYGLVGGKANSIRPGKRMLSSMTPTIVLKNGKPHILIGGPGGSRIPTGVAQVLMNLIWGEMEPLEAVSRPRVHYQWLPDEVLAEAGALTPELKSRLQVMGYAIREVPVFPYGRVEVIRVNGLQFSGASDPRSDGAARAVNSDR